MSGLELYAYNWLMRWRGPPPSAEELLLVAIDERRLARCLKSREPFAARVSYQAGVEVSDTMKNPGTAAVLSFFIPGVGQIYNGKILRGIFWLIITPGFWIGTGGLLGWVCHVIAAWTAYNYAKRHPY